MNKIVSKIIIGHIRSLLGKLVSPVQSAFVQELIHSLDNKKGKVGFKEINVEKSWESLTLF